MKSQYTEAYMEETMERINAGLRPYSVGTFLAYRLRGHAKQWISRYINSLKKSLCKEGWYPCDSILHGEAFCPLDR